MRMSTGTTVPNCACMRGSGESHTSLTARPGKKRNRAERPNTLGTKVTLALLALAACGDESLTRTVIPIGVWEVDLYYPASQSLSKARWAFDEGPSMSVLSAGKEWAFRGSEGPSLNEVTFTAHSSLGPQAWVTIIHLQWLPTVNYFVGTGETTVRGEVIDYARVVESRRP